MSTSNPLSGSQPSGGKEGGDLSADPDRHSSQAAALAGLPDPAVLERMANEFFRAIPGTELANPVIREGARFVPPADVSSLSLSSMPPAPALSTAPGVSGLPSKIPHPAMMSQAAQAGALPGVVSPVIVPQSTNAPTSVPGVPAAVNALPTAASMPDFHGIPGFGFLSGARGLLHSPPAAPIHAGPTLDAGKVPFSNSIPGAVVPNVPVTAADAAVPQVPGTASMGRLERGDPFGFLQDLSALEHIDAMPATAPVSSQFPAVPYADISSGGFDVNAIRRDFPILQERVNGRPLVWLDNAATTQKPQAVIDRLAWFYAHENSNIHRAAHTLAARATDAYEAAREKVRRFLNAGSVKEIIFVRGATEGINLVAQSWGRRNIQKDDEIVVTHLEHHANIVPWQMLCAEKGAKLRVAPVDDSGQVRLEEYERLFNPRTRLAAFAHVSNALGTVTPVVEMIEIAHRHGARVLVDGAQSVAHARVDMQAYDCDFFVFSGHKVFAPTGIGVVYGKSDVLENTPPWHGGGNMIVDVTFEKTTYQLPPGRFEAGTGSIGDAVGLGAAIDYVERIGMANISRYEHDLLVYATNALQRIPGLRLIGTAKEKASVLSFVLDGFRTEDVGAALNQQGIAVRSGHHCAQPILRRFGVETTVRPSLALYNTCEDVDALVAALWNLKGGRGPGLI